MARNQILKNPSEEDWSRRWLIGLLVSNVPGIWRVSVPLETKQLRSFCSNFFAGIASPAGDATFHYPANLTSFSGKAIWQFLLMAVSGTHARNASGCHQTIGSTGKKR